nr:general secretion pathway protein GspB [uncultured Desulfuromonas sp.]
MSFILEALKKSEKNRQENATPTLDSQHDSASSTTPKRPVWPLVLVVVLILNAGILLWLFGPWNSDEAPEVATAPKTDTAVETPVQTAVVEPKAPVTPPVPQPAVQQPTQAAPATVVMPEPQVAITAPAVTTPLAEEHVVQSVVTTKPVADVAQPAAAQEPAPQPQQVQAVVEPIAQPVATPQAPARKVLALTELPGSMQQQLPRLHMSVHAFTGDQNTSLIRLNDRIMRAGSMLENRYRLEEITTDGAVFSYQGYYFLVPRRGA